MYLIQQQVFHYYILMPTLFFVIFFQFFMAIEFRIGKV